MKKLLMLFVTSFLILISLVSCSNEKGFDYSNEGIVGQSHEILGHVKRKLPKVSNGGLERYPIYNESFDGDEAEKTLIMNENKTLISSSSTYDKMDESGNLYLNGEATGSKLYKHSASVGLYGGDVSDKEKAVIKKINITPRNLGNYITGLYAPAGEVIKIEISEEDLANTGGFEVWIGNAGNRSSGAAEIPLDKTFTRMPLTVNAMKVAETVTYVGSFLGGAIYLGEPKNKDASYSVTISGAVEYSHFILGLTTKDDFERTSKTSAPYFDLEIWDDSIRHSGPKYLLESMDYDNFYDVAKMWENISLVSNQIPSASANVGIGMRYDTYVPAGAAVAFVGANFCVMPLSWFNNSLNYEYFTNNGMWGTIHEYNHHYQKYGASEGGEVTNNAASILSYALYTKISSGRNISKDLDGWNAYTYASYPLKTLLNNASEDPIYSLDTYAVLIHSFGVDTFLKAVSLQETKGNDDSWYIAFSEASGYDMTYYFEELCNYTLSQEAKDTVKALGYKTFIPMASIYQTKTSYNEMHKTVRPYELEYGQLVEVNVLEELTLPSGINIKEVKVTGETNGKLVQIENGFSYEPNELDFNSNEINVAITYDCFGVDETLNLTYEFIQKDKKVQTITYKYSEALYKNIAIAEANDFKGYESVSEGYANSFTNNNLQANTITIKEAKVYINEESDYRWYIKGKDNVFMYISVGNNRNYKLASYINGNSNYTNDNPKAYYDVHIKSNTYVYIKTITLSKGDNGYSDIGYGKIIDETATANSLPTKYIIDLNSKYVDNKFKQINYYPRVYYTNVGTLDTSKFSIMESTNFTPWDENYTLDKMLDGNINTYAHNDSELTAEVSITIDMNKINKFNFIKLYGKNHEESHTPTTFDLYAGESVETLTLIGEYTDLDASERFVEVKTGEVNARYIKLVVKKTQSEKYVSISKIDIGMFIPTSKLISITDSSIKVEGKWIYSNSSLSNHSNVISSNSGHLTYDFEGEMIGVYAIVNKDTTIKISVDEQSYETIELKASDELQLIYLKEVELGLHQLEIKTSSKDVKLVSLFYN